MNIWQIYGVAIFLGVWMLSIFAYVVWDEWRRKRLRRGKSCGKTT